MADACGLLDTSEKVSDLENTIEALSDQLATEVKDNVATVGSLFPTDTNPIQTEIPTEPTPLATLAPTLQPTQPGFDNALTLLGQYGGSSFAVAVRGDYAYLGQGPRLVTLNISNPGAIEFISRSDLMPGVVQDVEVEGKYVFITFIYSMCNTVCIDLERNMDEVYELIPEEC